MGSSQINNEHGGWVVNAGEPDLKLEAVIIPVSNVDRALA